MNTVEGDSHGSFSRDYLFLGLLPFLVDAFQLLGLENDSGRQRRVCLLGAQWQATRQAAQRYGEADNTFFHTAYHFL